MNIAVDSKKIAYQKNSERYELRYETLIEALEKRAVAKPEFLIFMDLKNKESRVSAKDILTHGKAVAQYLIGRGLKQDDKVVVMLPTGAHFAYIYFGILLAGGVPVPVSQPAGTSNLGKYLDNLKHIIHDCEARYFITYEKIKVIAASLMNISDLVSGFLFDDEIFANPVPVENHKPLPVVKPDDLALIQYTSGTTGKPKGVMLSHRNLLHNIHGIGVASEMTPDDVGISWLPMYHDMGLIGGFLSTLYWHISMVLMAPEAFIFKPVWWLENISKYRVTMGVAPNFGYHYCVTRIDDASSHRLDLSAWRLALNGAEPIDRNTLTKFLEKFGPRGLRDDIFLPVYGMAENSLAATFPSLKNTTVVRRFNREKIETEDIAVDSNSENSKEYIDLVSVGYPLVGQEVRIANENGETLHEREIGEILVKSPSLMSGYYENPEATREALKNGWLHTGDMGFILDGLLFISGRKKEMIIKRGKNIYPYDIERIASTVAGVRLGCCAAFDVHNENEGTEDLVLVCETCIKENDDLDRLKRDIHAEVLAKLGIAPDDIMLVPKGTIPKTTSGKVQRYMCKRIYLEGELILSQGKNLLVIVKTFLMSHFHLFRRRMRQ
ncbi:MAG: fatty acyl-AMP ligase [Spirochaetes bacterium]|nr:fatty acyl-AMP ligase [Spirochaetota bacterium]